MNISKISFGKFEFFLNNIFNFLLFYYYIFINILLLNMCWDGPGLTIQAGLKLFQLDSVGWANWQSNNLFFFGLGWVEIDPALLCWAD